MLNTSYVYPKGSLWDTNHAFIHTPYAHTASSLRLAALFTATLTPMPANSEESSAGDLSGMVRAQVALMLYVRTCEKLVYV